MKKLIVAVLMVSAMNAQAWQVTKCTDGRSVIVVDGYQCPAGWWPKY